VVAAGVAGAGAGVGVAGVSATAILATSGGPPGWLLIPVATIPVVVAGSGLVLWGADMYINEFNNLTDANLPGPAALAPFPRIPHCH
jgi:hypothetical protein